MQRNGTHSRTVEPELTCDSEFTCVAEFTCAAGKFQVNMSSILLFPHPLVLEDRFKKARR
jgi:hypothetical protein